MTTFASPQELAGSVGSHLGYSDWLEITQERIDAFADATDDHQWIHVDPERAKSGPFGTTIAHGYLTLSLAVRFVDEIFAVEGVRMGVNYGTNKVRFVSPVPVGSKLRAGGIMAAIEELQGCLQATLDLTFEIEGTEKPACVAQVLYRLYL
jgi:acyl dehydratase